MYARKSSEAEDRQVASIEAQMDELKKLARENNLVVAGTFTESKSAKQPGRPVFNQMLERVNKGEANGIICWKLDRLARNPVDGGQISWMLQQGVLQRIQTYGREYNPSDNVLMMQVELGMANQYIRDLSTNVKRGLESKIRSGWFPGVAPNGYENSKLSERGSNIILVDQKRFPIIQKGFKLILYGGRTPMETLDVLNKQWSYKTIRRKKLGGGPLRRTVWYNMLVNPFYCGWIERPQGSGNLVPGAHKPMLTKEEFDRIQVILGSKGRRISQTREFAYTCLMRCGECGCGVTAEEKNQIICSSCKYKFACFNKTQCPKCGIEIEKMKSPTRLNYVYYHCTKKKEIRCAQGSIEVEDLEKQIDEYLTLLQINKKYAEWAIKHLKESHQLESKSRQSIQESQQEGFNKITKQLDGLLEMRMNNEITENEYAQKKTKLALEKSQYEQAMSDISHRQDKALELSEKTFNFVYYSRFWLKEGDKKHKRDILSTLGSNLVFKDKILNIQAPEPFEIIRRGLTSIPEAKVRFEPKKTLVSKKQNDLIKSDRLTWLGSWGSNPGPSR